MCTRQGGRTIPRDPSMRFARNSIRLLTSRIHLQESYVTSYHELPGCVNMKIAKAIDSRPGRLARDLLVCLARAIKSPHVSPKGPAARKAGSSKSERGSGLLIGKSHTRRARGRSRAAVIEPPNSSDSQTEPRTRVRGRALRGRSRASPGLASGVPLRTLNPSIPHAPASAFVPESPANRVWTDANAGPTCSRSIGRGGWNIAASRRRWRGRG
jgi:hypothetical protein